MADKPLSEYEPVASVPDDLKWRPQVGHPSKTHVKMVSTPGQFFRLERELATGAVKYYRLKDMGPAMTSKEKLDTEPTRGAQVRYRVGAQCWFIDQGRWFLVKVVDRTGGAAGTGTENRITIAPVTGFDADKQAPWPYGEFLEFPTSQGRKGYSPLFDRLRPLRDRYQ